jgi:hypothetical protein
MLGHDPCTQAQAFWLKFYYRHFQKECYTLLDSDITSWLILEDTGGY